MARELVLDVVAKKNSRQLSELASEFERLSKQTDDFGRKLNQTGKFSQFVDQELAKTKQLAKELGEEFERTGNQDVFARMRGAQGNIAALERIKKDLAKSLEQGGIEGGELAGRSFAQRFRDKILSGNDFAKRAGSSFSEGFTSGLKPGLISAAVLGAVTLTPGAVLAATGLAGLGLGIVGQLRSDQVKHAFTDMGHDLADELNAATVSFEKPLVESAHVLRDALGQAIRSVDFSALSKLLVPLASGFGGFIENIMPGFNKALAAAGPIIEQLSSDLPLLGDAVSQMFEDFSKGGTGARESIHLLTALLAGLALGIGKVVLAASTLVERIVSAGEKVSWWTAAITAHVPLLGKWANGLHNLWQELQGTSDSAVVAGRSFTTMAANAALSADDIAKLSAQINEAHASADTLAGAMAGKLLDSMMSLDQASLHWHESLTSLQQAFEQNGRSLDINTQKGQANREAVLSAVTANMQQYQAQIAAGMSAIDAAAAYDQNTAALERQLRKAGLTQQQIDGLIGKYKNVPDQVNTQIAMQGLTDAIRGLDDVLRRINGLPSYKSITIAENIYTNDYRTYRQGERASGGPVVGGHAYLVGERRPEIFVPSTSGYIVPRTPQNGQGSSGEIKTTIYVEGADSAAKTAILSLFRGGLRIKSEWVTS